MAVCEDLGATLKIESFPRQPSHQAPKKGQPPLATLRPLHPPPCLPPSSIFPPKYRAPQTPTPNNKNHPGGSSLALLKSPCHDLLYPRFYFP